jgi:peptidyl-prolyl cis-trans isomerase D
MFDFVRNNSRVVLGALLLLIIPSFIFFGVEGYTSFRDGSNASVATVDGRSITRAEWERAHQRAVDRLRRENPTATNTDTDEARQQTLDALVRERVFDAAGRALHLAPPDTRLRRLFATDPQFAGLRNPDGSVNRELLATQGMSSEAFAQQLRGDFAAQQVLQGVARTALGTPAIADAALNPLLQRREVQVQRFAPAEFRSQVNPSDADLEAHYQARQADFRAAEQAQIEYLVLDLATLASRQTVAADDLRKFYDDNPARFGTPEERRASHVLIKVDASASAADKAKAKARAEELLAEARKDPKRFAEIARKHSQDEGSAAQGGDLDFFGKGAMVKPFEEAAFKLKPGEISEVFATDFGFHFLTVTATRGGQSKPFDTVKAEIEAELRQQLARSEWAKASQALTDIVYEQSDSLQPAADKLKLARQTATVSRTAAPGATGPLASAKLLNAVFASEAVEAKRNTDAIETGANQLVAARVLSHSPARVRPLAEVKDAVREALVAERSAALARQAGEARVQALRQNPAEALLGPSAMLSRVATQGAPASVIDAVMGADARKLPAVVGVDLQGAGYLVLRITQVLPRDPASGSDDQLRQRYAQAWAAAEAEAYASSLRTRFKAQVEQGARMQTETTNPPAR